VQAPPSPTLALPNFGVCALNGLGDFAWAHPLRRDASEICHLSPVREARKNIHAACPPRKKQPLQDNTHARQPLIYTPQVCKLNTSLTITIAQSLEPTRSLRHRSPSLHRLYEFWCILFFFVIFDQSSPHQMSLAWGILPQVHLRLNCKHQKSELLAARRFTHGPPRTI
jgi:hypothetical protein